MSRLNHLALMKAQFVHQAILGDLHGGAPGGFCAHARVRQLLPFRFQGGFPHATMRQPLKNDMAPAANDEQNGKKTMVFAKEHDLRTGGLPYPFEYSRIYGTAKWVVAEMSIVKATCMSEEMSASEAHTALEFSGSLTIQTCTTLAKLTL